MADKKIRGEQNRFIEGTNIEKHREWRGLKDTWYDYTQWIKLLGIVMKFVAISPWKRTAVHWLSLSINTG
jgi:hypothetical protein